MKKDKLDEKKCNCAEDCECGCQQGEECTCDGTCNCHDEECCCDEECNCHGHCDCEQCDCEEDEELCGCGCGEPLPKEDQYLALAQRLQADFDNYRKHVNEQLLAQREEGKRSVIEVFLPCLDTFKEAKKSIEDEKVLAGINMIENKIQNALATLNVFKIDAIGQKYDHNLHEVIAVMHDESKEDDIILDEFQAGYKLNDKVIRFSKVIVNKKGE